MPYSTGEINLSESAQLPTTLPAFNLSTGIISWLRSSNQQSSPVHGMVVKMEDTPRQDYHGNNSRAVLTLELPTVTNQRRECVCINTAGKNDNTYTIYVYGMWSKLSPHANTIIIIVAMIIPGTENKDVYTYP